VYTTAKLRLVWLLVDRVNEARFSTVLLHTATCYSLIGLTENDGHENDGPSKLQDMNLQDMKLTDQVAGREIAGHENDGPNSRA